MLFMLTPEIKTNLILKEIGIKRYSLRSSNDQSHKKSLHFYKKGHILALLDKPYENFVREQQDLLIAIFSSTKIDNGEEVFKTIRYSSNNDLSNEFEEMNDLKMIVIFGNISCDFDFKNGDSIRVWCSEWDQSNKNVKNSLYTDSLSVSLSSKEQLDFIENEAY